MELKQRTPTTKPEGHEALNYLKLRIDEMCSEIARKFNLYGSRGKPRKAFIMDALLRYACPGCIFKVLSQPYRRRDIDPIYAENHRLAVNLLVDRLRHRLGEEGLDVTVQGEVYGEYGRVDVLIEPVNCEVMLELGDPGVVVEVKTGKGFSHVQLLRYLIDRPNAAIVVWRVMMRQVFAVEGRKVRQLLLTCMDAAIRRGMRVISGDAPKCSHNPISGRNYTIDDPQGLIEDFTSRLVETLPEAVDTILGVLKASSPAGPGGETVEA